MSVVVIGGMELLKFFENWTLSRVALGAGDEAGVP